MTRTTYMLVRLAAIVILYAPAAHGQGSETWGFVNARYDTRSPTSIYTGYGWRDAFAIGGVLHSPRSGYSELMGGVGVVVRTGANANHWFAVATARTGSVSLAQLYWLPTVRTGRLTTRAAVKWSDAYKGSARQKLSISPVSMTLPLWRRLSGGVAMEMAAAEGARTIVGTGLELRLRLPNAALGAATLHDLPGNGSRSRLFCSSTF